MHIEVYLFYIALAGIIILLSYKMRIVRAYDKMNKNHIFFDPFPKTRLWVLEGVHAGALVVRIYVWKPVRKKIVRGIIHTCRGGIYVFSKIQVGKRKLGKMIEARGTASGYMQKIAEQKKKIREEQEREQEDSL